MKRTMLKIHQPANGQTVHFVYNGDKAAAQSFAEEFLTPCGAEFKAFEVAKMPLEELPDEVQQKAKSILKAYNQVNVVFEYNEFSVSASTCIKSSYHWDHFVCGRYFAKDVYTEEERRQNYQECFGC
jgi:hypothetical protein